MPEEKARGVPTGLPGQQGIQGKSGKAPCYCYCKCQKPGTPEFTGIYSADAPANLTLAYEEDVQPAPSTAFGIAPLAGDVQLAGLGAVMGLEQPTTAIAASPVQQLEPRFDTTVMPGGVFSGPVMPFGGGDERFGALGGVGGREDTPGGMGGIAGVGIGPMPWMREEEFQPPPPREALPPTIDTGAKLVTASKVGQTFDNITGTAEYATPLEPPVAPDYSFLGYPRERRIRTEGLEVAPHAGYFYFGGMDQGPNAGIGSNGVPRYHDGYDQVRDLGPPREPEAMCGHAMSTGELAMASPRPLAIFKGEERALALGRGVALAPDSVADTLGGMPPIVEADAPLSPLRQDLVVGGEGAEAPERLSRGATAVLGDLLQTREDLTKGAFAGGGVGAREGGFGLAGKGEGTAAALLGGRQADPAAGAVGGGFQGQGFGGPGTGQGPSGAAALAAAGSMQGVGGGGGGGLVAQAANARIDLDSAQAARDEAQRNLADAKAALDKSKEEASIASAKLTAARTPETSATGALLAAEDKYKAAYQEFKRVNDLRMKGLATEAEERAAAQKADDAERNLKEAKAHKLTDKELADISAAVADQTAKDEALRRAQLAKEEAEREAAIAEARFKYAQAEMDRVLDEAVRSGVSFGQFLDRVDEAIERYRVYRQRAQERLDRHDAKMAAGIGGGSKDEKRRKAAIAVARDARLRGAAAREGRDLATAASARLTQLRGYVTKETVAAVKAAIKALKELSAKEKEAAKRDKNAARYGTGKKPKDPEAEKKAKEDAKKELEAKKSDLAEALKKAEEEAAANKGDKDKKDDKGDKKKDGKPHEYSGVWPDCDPAKCVCPGGCDEKKGEKCLWCIWIPWPPPGEKGKGAGALTSLAGLMPQDTGIMGLMGFPFYAMAQEVPPPPQQHQPPPPPPPPPPPQDPQEAPKKKEEPPDPNAKKDGQEPVSPPDQKASDGQKDAKGAKEPCPKYQTAEEFIEAFLRLLRAKASKKNRKKIRKISGAITPDGLEGILWQLGIIAAFGGDFGFPVAANLLFHFLEASGEDYRLPWSALVKSAKLRAALTAALLEAAKRAAERYRDCKDKVIVVSGLDEGSPVSVALNDDPDLKYGINLADTSYWARVEVTEPNGDKGPLHLRVCMTFIVGDKYDWNDGDIFTIRLPKVGLPSTTVRGIIMNVLIDKGLAQEFIDYAVKEICFELDVAR